MSTAARFRQMPTTTTMVIQAQGKPRISARNVVAQRQQRLSAEDAKDPANLARTLTFLQENIARASEALRNEPEIGAIIFQKRAVTSGTTFVLTHNFGRPFQGYRVTRTYAGAASPIALQDGALPTGLSVNSAIALVPSATGTIDVRVW